MEQPELRCQRIGFNTTFSHDQNPEGSCQYHASKCCDVHVREFDEFMSIPPCTKGWHNAEAKP